MLEDDKLWQEMS